MNYTEVLKFTDNAIKCWIDSWGSNGVYVAFSGGKDSTVLLDIVRKISPNVTAAFNNTGLEFPEIVKFVKTFENVEILRPKIPFHKVIEKYGWPVISKEQSQFIHEYRNTKSDKLRDLRWNGRVNGRSKISEKWKFAVNAPFKIGHQCCNKLKKDPAKRFEKTTGKKPILGIMSGESQLRKQQGHVCNLYDQKRPVSRPLLPWTEEFIWRYIKENQISYCSIYDKGWDRSGCVFCLYGIHKDNPNKFQLMKKTHPHLYRYCFNKLGVGEVLEFMNIVYK